MKRFHVHVSVAQLNESISFYSALFGAPPSVERSDYAKWMLEDPRVNFAISTRDQKIGINHVGFQVDSPEELAELRAQLETADSSVIEQTGAACCYARSDKHWVTDPSGIAWETFRSLGEVPMFGENMRDAAADTSCCIPLAKTAESTSCCVPTSAATPNREACCA